MALRIYNTLTRKKEPFESLKSGQIDMYVCGPTVYDKAHVGHAMSTLVFDIVRRYVEHRGFEPVEGFDIWVKGFEGGRLQISTDGGKTMFAL